MATNVSIDIEHDEHDIIDNAPRGPEEKKFRLSYLRSQFQSLQLNNLYKPYTDKINHGYFSLFLILQFCLSVAHFVVLFISNYTTNEDISIILPDLILYAVVAILSLVGVFIIDIFMNKSKCLIYLVYSAFIIIFFMNFSVPIYHELSNNGHFRPTYTTHLVLYCYIFLNLPSNLMAIALGIVITTCHLLSLYFINYANSDNSFIWRRLGSDMLYLLCINALGINFQYLNEIIKRRSFLDRRDCIVSKYQISHEQKQEEQLLSSIIPRSIIAKVKEQHLSNIDRIKNEKFVTHKPFDDSLLEEHTNVTILFADIVNYTEMTTKLKIIDLLDTLNELFGSFDDASEVLKVTRIKFLGDCYYCVSGLPPDPAPNHGEACVDLGLQMISLIAEVRNRRQLNINMRIGIHTGKIISGVIGMVKYQFDIWSKDVDIANKMETEGVPGKVHITEQTRCRLKKDYDIEDTNKGETVPLFAQNGIKTFLITPKATERVKDIVKPLKQDTKLEVQSENAPRISIFKKRTSIKPNNSVSGPTFLSQLHKSAELDATVATEVSEEYENQLKNSLQKKRSSTMLTNSLKRNTRILEEKRIREEVKRRTAFMNTNIKRHNEMSQDVNEEMTETIMNLSFSKYRQYFTFHEVNNLLCFRNCKQEIGYITQPDPLFKFYLLSNLLVLICTYVIQNLTLTVWDWYSWEFYVTLAVIMFLLPFTWTYFIWSRYVYTWMKDEIPKKSILKFFYKSSTFISSSFCARLLIYTTVMVLFSVCILSEVIECELFISKNQIHISKDNFLSLLIRQFQQSGNYVYNQKCAIPWHMTETCSLAIIMAFLFVRSVIWVKFIYALIITVIYAYCVTLFGSDFYNLDETFNYGLKPQYAHILAIAFLTFTLHLIDRQTDYMNRLDYLTAEKLKASRSRANDLHMINKELLNNILPRHVALKYLDLDRDLEEVYHEYHSNVAVMFASIIISEDDKNLLNEKEILVVINNYIGDFDKILRREEFNGKIEKIKMSKWTYMAVCGLNPGNPSEIERHASQSPIIILLDFASKIMQQTDKLNKELFGPDIKLRIGIAHGNIVAGVVGSKKPLYDVWGDAVNMASRMDSTGVIDRIQIIDRTADIVEKIGYDLEFRGEIPVKGRVGLVPTYFLKLDTNYNLIRKEL